MSEQLKPCCDKFAEQAETQQIYHDPKKRVWNVNGCCSGGCYVITDLVFCPWCGSRLPGTDSLELPKAPLPK